MSVTYCLDTNVLLRLQDEDKLDALATVVDCAIVLTDIVWDEATRKPVVGTAAKKVLLNIPHLTKHDLLPNADDTLQFDKLRTRYPLPAVDVSRRRAIGDRARGTPASRS